jgi:tetratricopeptide (TPR) repeat protein
MIDNKNKRQAGNRIWFVLVFFFCGGLACAQIQQKGDSAGGPKPWWYTLERGKNQFTNGDYGNALLTFEDARRQRQAMFGQLEESFIKLLSVSEVRRLGDSLDWVERYANERFYADAVTALEELYYRVPRESLNNSAAAALAALGSLKPYPEAEYWIGEVYRAEGELGLALIQFQKAHEQRGLFENPGFDTELLYKIAGLHKTRQEYNEMVRTLLLILDEDRLWSEANGGGQRTEKTATAGGLPAGVSGSFAVQAMTRTLETEGAGRFLTMYRYNNHLVEEAHRLLGFYYYISGRHSRAQEHLMFAFLIQNTIIIEEVIRHQYDFTFTSLEALAAEINRYPLLSGYAEKTGYYKTAYYLGASLYGSGKTAAARQFWTFLGAREQAGEWRGRAIGQLASPHIEQVVEMP